MRQSGLERLRHPPRLLAGLLALAWLTVVASLYYVGHKPFTPALAAGLAKSAWQTAAAFGLLSLAGGLGRRLWPDPELRPLAALAVQAGLGAGLLSLGVLAFGATLGLNLYLAWAAVLVLGVVLRIDLGRWLAGWQDLAQIWRQSDRFGRAMATGLGLILVCTWLTAAAPPLKFDALVYHLSLPQTYLSAGQVGERSQVMFWGMPQTGEMLFTWAMALAGTETAPIFGWLAGWAAVVGLVGYCAQHFGERAGWVAGGALLCGYTLAASLAWGYVDWLALLFGFGCLTALTGWRSGGGDRDLILAGAFAGLAVGTKYTAGVVLLAGMGVILGTFQPTGLRRTAVHLARFGLPAIILSLPWWVKNILATGNPFYPFFFPAGAMDAFRLDFYLIEPWGGWQEAILLPWRATLAGVEGAYGYNASIGPLLLALAPFAGLGWGLRTQKQGTAVSTAALIGLQGLMIWAIAARFSGYLIQARLYWVIFPALVFLSAAGFHALDGLAAGTVRFGRVAGALVLVVFGFTTLQAGVDTLQQGALQVRLALQTEDEYQSQNLGWYARAVHAVRDMPGEAQVLMLWEPRSFDCQPKCIPDEILDRWMVARREGQSPEGVLESWRAAGYTHLLFNRFGAEYVRREDARYSPSDWASLEELLARLPEPVDFGGAYQIYSLTP